MKPKRKTCLVVIASMASFMVFVLAYELHARSNALMNVNRHADVVANSLWNYNRQSISEYLDLACRAGGYEYLRITDNTGGKFMESRAGRDGWVEDSLIRLRLTPRVVLVSDVVYEGKTIGKIEVLWKSRTLYVEVLVLLAILALLVIFLMYLRIMRSRNILEEKVAERTSELSGANASLVKEMDDRAEADREKKKLETQLRQAQKMEAIGTLAGGIAHDFNNLLFPIMGYTEMMLSDLPQDAPIRDKLLAVLSASRRARDLVLQILTLARQTQEIARPVHCGRIVEDVVRLLKATIPSFIEIRMNLCDQGGIVLADPTHVHQVVLNLCTNAFHAMRDQGGVLEVILDETEMGLTDVLPDSDVEPGRYVRLSVRDTGSGMEPGVMDRIFEPYFTTKDVGEGTGMGLSVVHGIVARYRGDIQVCSQPGKGTRFDVYFPRLSPGREETRPPEGESVIGQGESILLVDDEPLILSMMGEMLASAGYRVTLHSSAAQALAAFRENPGGFDAVITDMTMPHMTGDVLARNLMTIRPGIPVILCTGFSEKINGDRARQLGIPAFLIKPVDMRKLAETLQSVLGKGGEA